MLKAPTTTNPSTFFSSSQPTKVQRPKTPKPALKFDEATALGGTTFDLMNSDDGTTISINREYDLAILVMQISKFAEQIAKSKGNPFSVVTNRFGGKKIIRCTKFGTRFMLFFNADISGIFRHFPSHQFDPHFMAVIEAMRARNLGNAAPLMHPMPETEVVRLVNTLNGCIQAIRDIVNSAAFQAGVRNFRRPSDKNTKELTKYVRKIFCDHERVLVLRIDLAYCKEWNRGTFVNTKVSLPETKAHWAKLLNDLDKLLPAASKLGFARKFEFTLLKGYQVRLFLFIDGSLASDDAKLARLVGDAWQSEEVTGGRGIYFNWNAKKDPDKHLGIGMVGRDDTVRRQALSIAVQSLTKPDLYIKIPMSVGGQLFAKGNTPKPTQSRQGRPRNITEPAAEDIKSDVAAT